MEREIQKVTDPSRIVADEHLLRELERWGIDKDYVEFFQDYSPRSKGKEHSPYAKFYRDLKSGKRFMVASGLPMVKALGRKIEAGWLYANGKYYSKANLFSAIVEGNRVQVTCLSDQPDGRKLNDRVIWQPQLFLNGVEQSFGKATLLETDPTNENYHQNVLEWDYGICQRRLRIIEGRVRERWVFAGNPHGEVRIKHNQVGDYRLKLGRFKVNDDEELILAEAFILPNYFFTEYPIEIGASATFYPDADPETSSFDGMCYPWEEVCIDITWAIVRDYFVSEYGDAVDDTDYLAIQIQTCVQTDRFKAIIRSPCLFDISPLPPGATLDSGTFSLYGYAKNDDLNINPSINIFESNPQSNTAIAITDYALARWGSTPFSTAIAHDDFNIGDPGTINNFPINAAGITFLQAAADGDGIVKFGLREATYDAPNNPTWGSNAGASIVPYSTDKGVGYKPQLVVAYDVVTETLRPNAAGDECNINGELGDPCPDHYLNVIEDTSAAYVQNEQVNSYQRDLYNVGNSSIGSGTINSVKVYIDAMRVTTGSAKICLKSGGVVSEGSEITLYHDWTTYSETWNTPPEGGSWDWDKINALQVGVSLKAGGVTTHVAMCRYVDVAVNYTVVLPTVTTQAASDVGVTTATGHGNITDHGGENCDIRGIVWDLASHGDPGNVAPGASGYANDVPETDSFGTGAFTRSLTGLPSDDTIYCRAYAHNSAGYSYGAEVNFLTKKAAPQPPSTNHLVKNTLI